ncbi:hypothetical protein CHLRE_10g423250v5 [Chlamydomonas reinhardtii]|uniref:Malate dehydrogenase n=1 Tax=Chlamydomonas reinhardtii TaxID=3055 RepID=A8ICG9_CHLRE|nr:uncharacterized protein CHLRE_10g423250v5 [Chlamydomonas reinhardtii]PNW77127.1 hypothetical protein CHLRE_10g423250v5 [Chlamydomonas reinhardtii]|eukprot:XP_001702586.1 malate dehydrogenase [Chlamydomonas reinhardtii]
MADPLNRIQKIASHLDPAKPRKFKVALLGAAGGIGQPLSLLLKMSPYVSDLALYDVANTPGVAADVSHMSTAARVRGYLGPDQLGAALTGAALVIIPAGVPRKPGMTRDDLFNINAGIVRGLAQGIAQHCPAAWVAIISNPVNSTVPIAAEVLQKAGVFNPAKLFGVTTLDVVRAEAFIGELTGTDPRDVHVPVVGGHAGVTILPLLSQARPPLPASMSAEARKALMVRIQDAGTEVVQAKAGAGSATLSMAYAAARFADSCLRAMSGEGPVSEYAYIRHPPRLSSGSGSSVAVDLPYFSSPVRLGRLGVEEVLPLGPMDALEADNFAAMKAELLGSIKKGVEFAAKGPAPAK